MNMQHVTLFLLIDLCAAFGTVDHSILLNRLRLRFGISGTPSVWFKSDLSGRKQFISLNGTTSSVYPLEIFFIKDIDLDLFCSLFILPCSPTSSKLIYLISIAMQMILNSIFPS
eukprot:TRINITY_DN10949_c0_g1_i1.p1 TRINITY_DN10949_c0_g1~~TRINITY_DN10949_c0_g1_i1.p1  ORF type:complete len:114 (+),score=9.26 TRINITY_DN10949_c0_g1_i1:181-522(+)